MAKGKKQAAVVDEPIEEIFEEVPAIEEETVVEKPDITENFIMRKLRVINNMDDSAKAQRLAERVLMNRKG